MKRGARVLLGGAAIAILAICGSIAQDTVSLVGMSASRNHGAAVIELHTSGPADFKVERFTMGDWVSVWSNELAFTDSASEIPLAFERPELADLVTGASLAAESHHASIRFYLGPSADRTHVFVVNNGETATVTIAARSEEDLELAADAVGDNQATAEPAEEVPAAAPETHMAAELARSEADQDAAPPAQPETAPLTEILAATPPTTLPPEPEPVTTPAPALPPAVEPAPAADEPEAAEADTTRHESVREAAEAGPADSAPSGRNSTGSFYVPRQHSAEPIPAAPAADPPSQPPSSATSVLDGPTTLAEMNYQFIPADQTGGRSPAEDQGRTDEGGDADESPSVDEMMRTAAEMLQQMLPAAEGQPAGAAEQTGIATPDTFGEPFRQLPSLSAGALPPLESGKDALSRIMIDLFEIVSTPLDQAITLLIAPTDYNIIVDASVGSNSVSLSFKDGRTDLKSALDMITKTYGLEYTVQANTIVVAAKEKIEGQLVDYATRLFVLSFADPFSIKEVLTATAMLREDQIEVYVGEDEYLEVNDSTTLSEATGRNTADSEQMQSNLSSTPRNAVLVKAVPAQMEIIAELIDRLDRKPRLIELEVRVCEITESGRKDLGLTVNDDFIGNVKTDVTWTEQSGETAFEAFTLGSFYRSPMRFAATLKHLVETGDAKILAQPQLSTVEGKQAIYFAGESIPYVAERKIDPNTGQETLTVEFIEIGVTLNFKPRLDNEGMLTIDVNPIISSLIEMMEVTDGVFAPRSQNRQLRTTVRVQDGEPFAMAGLISERESETISKIPLLAELPLVGKLFRNRRHDVNRTEIMVIVVPHIHE